MKLKSAAALAAAMTLAVTAPAMGTPIPTSVEVGGSAAAMSHPIDAIAPTVAEFGIERTSGDYAPIVCDHVEFRREAGSEVRSGTDVLNLMVLKAATYWPCSGAGGPSQAFTLEGAWTLRRTGSEVVTPSLTDRWRGDLVDIDITSTNIVCSFRLSGRAAGTFNEATQVLTINEQANRASGLSLTDIRGCGGGFKVNGRTKLAMKLKITSPDGPINAVP